MPRHALARAAISILATLLVSSGSALAVPPAGATGLARKVADAVIPSLPAGLALTDVQVSALRFPGDPCVTLVWTSPPRSGRIGVLVVARDATKEVGRGYAMIELRPLAQVLVAGRPLIGGAKLREGDVLTALAPVAEREGFRMDPSALEGAPVLRDVAAGQVLSDADVARPAPMARGSSLKVLVRRGGVTIAAEAVLERNARPGERTVARLVEGQTLVSGRLVDDHTLINEGARP